MNEKTKKDRTDWHVMKNITNCPVLFWFGFHCFRRVVQDGMAYLQNKPFTDGYQSLKRLMQEQTICSFWLYPLPFAMSSEKQKQQGNQLVLRVFLWYSPKHIYFTVRLARSLMPRLISPNHVVGRNTILQARSALPTERGAAPAVGQPSASLSASLTCSALDPAGNQSEITLAVIGWTPALAWKKDARLLRFAFSKLISVQKQEAIKGMRQIL